jgi:hypothetical protein
VVLLDATIWLSVSEGRDWTEAVDTLARLKVLALNKLLTLLVLLEKGEA